MIKIRKDPLNIAISLIFNLNLLEENKEYNINEIRSLRNLDQHWITIQRYLKIFNLTQKYLPKIELNGSKLRIIKSKIYNNLNEKEKIILYLFNNNALNSNDAVNMPDNFDISTISESIDYLYKRTGDNKFYLTESGIDVYKSIMYNLSDLIYNEKEINDVFGKREEFLDYKTDLKKLSSSVRSLFLKELKEIKKLPESSALIIFDPINILLSLNETSKDKMLFTKENDLTELKPYTFY